MKNLVIALAVAVGLCAAAPQARADATQANWLNSAASSYDAAAFDAQGVVNNSLNDPTVASTNDYDYGTAAVKHFNNAASKARRSASY